ncbi:MAG: hypothetical protein IKO10_16170 [Lachnospiraceae bacterium]|nr:hypothetical protein [Lachnospiraceae bacterium]
MFNGQNQFSKSFGYNEDLETRRKALDFYARYAHSFYEKKAILSSDGESHVISDYKEFPDIETAKDVYLSVNYMPENFESRKSDSGFIRGVNLRLDFPDLIEDDLLEICYDIYKNMVSRRKLPGVNMAVLTGSGLELYMAYDHDIIDVCEMQRSRYHKLVALDWEEKAINYLKEHYPTERIEVSVSTGERSDMCCLPGYMDSKSGKVATLIFTSSLNRQNLKDHCEELRIPKDARYDKLDVMIREKKKKIEALDQSRRELWDTAEAQKEREKRRKEQEKRKRETELKAEREKARQEKAVQKEIEKSSSAASLEEEGCVAASPGRESSSAASIEDENNSGASTEETVLEEIVTEPVKVRTRGDIERDIEQHEALYDMCLLEKDRADVEAKIKEFQRELDILDGKIQEDAADEECKDKGETREIRWPNPNGLNPASRNCAAVRLEQIRMLIKKRGSLDLTEQRHALFLFWRNLQIAYEEPTMSIRMLREMNSSLPTPLTAAELDNIIYSPRPYTHKGIFFEKLMNLTREEVEMINLYGRQRRMDKIEANKEKKAQDKDLAKSMYLSGVSIAEIAGRLDRKWDTVQRWLKTMGVYHSVGNSCDQNKNKSSKNDADGEVLCQLPQKSEQKNILQQGSMVGNSNTAQSSGIVKNNAPKAHKNAKKHEVLVENNSPKEYVFAYSNEPIFEAGQNSLSIHAVLSDIVPEKHCILAASTEATPKNRAFLKNGAFLAEIQPKTAETGSGDLMATSQAENILDFLKRRTEGFAEIAAADQSWQEEDHRLLAMDSGG